MFVASKSLALSGASLSVLGALIAAAPASAQPVQLGPVTVQDQTDKNALNHAPPVSTMPSTSLQDTPQAVTVVSGETMRQQATTTLGDRAEIMKRIEMRDRLVEDGEWEE